MPELTSLTALDIALGLAVVFFLLSTVCSAINELVAGWLGWRAQGLEKALRNILGDAGVTTFFAQERITALTDGTRNKPGKKRRSPSYVPARAFALAALDTFNPPLPTKAGAPAPAPDVIAQARTAAEDLPGSVRLAVLDALDAGRVSIDEIRAEVERHFDEVMDRCAGWYKRRTQKFLLLFAAILTVGLNVDTFHVADRLAKDDALRTAVVQRATATTQLPPASGDDLKDVAKQIDEVKRLGLPLGWAKANQPTDVWSGVGRVFGWLATILAVSLGAPFWFDVLGKFAKIRNAGKREETVKDDARSPEDPPR